MHRFSLKHLHLKVFEVQTSGIKHRKLKKKKKKKQKKNGGDLIWQMQNMYVQFKSCFYWEVCWIQLKIKVISFWKKLDMKPAL